MEGRRYRKLISTPLVTVIKSIRNIAHVVKCHTHFHQNNKYLDETLKIIFHGK